MKFSRVLSSNPLDLFVSDEMMIMQGQIENENDWLGYVYCLFIALKKQTVFKEPDHRRFIYLFNNEKSGE